MRLSRFSTKLALTWMSVRPEGVSSSKNIVSRLFFNSVSQNGPLSRNYTENMSRKKVSLLQNA